MATTRVTLGEPDRLKLTLVNRLLTQLTEAHHHACGCELCRARMLTDVQDAPGCWTVPGVILASEHD